MRFSSRFLGISKAISVALFCLVATNMSYAYTCPSGYTSDSTPQSIDDCYYNASAGSYVAYMPLIYDTSINGYGQNGNMGYKTIGYESDPLDTINTENTWYFQFSYGTLYGDSACRPYGDPSGGWNTVSDYNFEKGNQNNGAYCWCRLNSDNDPNPTITYKSKWVGRGTPDSNDCWRDCPYDCAQVAGAVYGWSDDIRPSMLNNTLLQTATCPAGSYCPGGKIIYGSNGVYQCPTNSTSSAGASACTCNTGFATLSGQTTTTTSPCYKSCGVGSYFNGTSCATCPTGFTTANAFAQSINECITISGYILKPNVDKNVTGTYTYIKDGSGYSEQSEFSSAHINSWRDFYSYGNLAGRAACSDMWAEYGSVSDTNFDPYTWYGQNCWCNIEQFGSCNSSNRTTCTQDNSTAVTSKWVSFGYVTDDRCWQDCAGKCANAIEQNYTFRSNALQSINFTAEPCPAGSYCPTANTPINYGDVVYSTVTKCPASHSQSDQGTTDEDHCFKDCEPQTGYTVTGRDYYNVTDTCVYTQITCPSNQYLVGSTCVNKNTEWCEDNMGPEYYWDSTNNTCVLKDTPWCIANNDSSYYWDATEVDCVSCGDGSYNSGTGSCDCDNGANLSNGVCVTCNEHEHWNTATSTCVSCGDGYWSNENNACYCLTGNWYNGTCYECQNNELWNGTACIPNVITITWSYSDEPESDITTTCNVGQTITTPSQPVRTGYTFVGWRVASQEESNP